MYDGDHFRGESERAASKAEIAGGLLGDPGLIQRVRRWGDTGAALIDDDGGDRTLRYLIATIGSLADQNAINVQNAISVWAQRLLYPLWLIAAASVSVALRGMI